MVYSTKFYVGYSDISKEFGLSNTSILKFFEDVATMHGHLAKDGLGQTDSRWFLSGYNVRILKRPAYGQYVTLNTWSREMKGVQASREFEIYDESGELCVTGLSNWIRINFKTGRLERITPEVFDRYESEPEKANFENCWLEKIKEPEGYDFDKDFHIERNFIDANNHMNNVYYMDLVTNTLPEDIYQTGNLKSFEMMYKSAIKYDETVNCSFKKENETCFVTIKSQDKGELKAVIKLNY